MAGLREKRYGSEQKVVLVYAKLSKQERGFFFREGSEKSESFFFFSIKKAEIGFLYSVNTCQLLKLTRTRRIFKAKWVLCWKRGAEK